MYNTIDDKIPTLKINVYSGSIRVVTNIIRIDTNPNNTDNNKLFFVKDYDYTNLIPYTFINSVGKKDFYKSKPSCNTLTALIKKSNKEQYETTVIGFT